MSLRRPLDKTAIGLMVLVCFIFSSQQLAMKGAAADLPPALQVGIRSLIAMILFGTFVWLSGQYRQFRPGLWLPGCMAGVLFCLEYIALGEGLNYTSTGHAVVFMYTSPIFAALGLHVLVPSERLSGWQWAGVGLAFAGILLAFVDKGSSGHNSIYGDLLCLAAGIAWGATTVLIRSSGLANAPALQTLLFQLGVTVVLMGIVMSPALEWPINLSTTLLLSLGWQTLVITMLGMTLWFWLIRHYPASRIGVLSFLTPVFGVILGAVWLHEEVEPGFIAGSLLVLAGILLVSGHEWLQQRRRAAQPTPTHLAGESAAG